MRALAKGKLFLLLAALLLLATGLILASCAGSTNGTLSGTVTNSLSNSPVEGVKITTAPVIEGVTIQTDSSGKFSAKLPIGTYTLKFEKTNFTTLTQTVAMVAGKTTTADAKFVPAKPVVVTAGAAQTSSPGATVNLAGNVTLLDGSTVKTYKWTQTAGTPATIANAASASTSVTLGKAADYKDALIEILKPIDRFGIQPVNPLDVEEATTATFKLTVTTSSSSYSSTVNVTANLPYHIASDIQDVPVGLAVLLNGKSQNTYTWTLAAPSGSKAALDGASDRNPFFTPDVAGKYTVKESKSGASIDVYAGTWTGVITGQDANGRPLAANCTVCHNGTIAPDKFTNWKNSGHAEIFTQNLNTSTHYGEDCFQCHTVGYNKAATNGGIDEASDYSKFLAAGLLNKPSNKNWTNVLANYPKTAQLANIQCESCHGPQQSDAHTKGSPRTSISAELCGTCHGEPARHGRYQQWEESGHGNVDLAILEATVENRGATAGHCGRCHSGEGFLAWTQQTDLTKVIQGKSGSATVDELKALGLTEATVHSQTCTTCHDPHAQGTTSGEPNTATVRIEGDTGLLPSGYKAVGVGKGALCMTCHNTRNGLHNDNTGNLTSYSAPHTAAQGDVLMGQNAYFVDVGVRSKHSFIKDTCVTCHMELTPPPAEFSYEGSGTNHAFNASLVICSKCHGEFDGGTLQESVEATIKELSEKMSAYLLNKMPAQVHLKDYTPHQYQGASYDVKSNDFAVAKTDIVSIEPTEPHGQQGFKIKLKTPINITYAPTGKPTHQVEITEAEVQLGDITADGKAAVIALSDPLIKAGWNFFLIEGDGSEGVHNPSYAFAVLNGAIDALK